MAANILNLNSDVGKIFLLNNFKGDTYQTTTRLVQEKEIKRSQKRFQNLKQVDEECACEENIEDIIGLNYATFKEPLIPQGQFREFIESNQEKTQMIKNFSNWIVLIYMETLQTFILN